MDLALRTLRDGAEPGAPAPLVVMEDSVEVLGGLELWRKVVSDLAVALATGRAQATRLTVVALARPPAEYAQLCAAALPGAAVEVLDCYADPTGTLGGEAAHFEAPPGGGQPGPSVRPLPGVLRARAGLLRLVAELGGRLQLPGIAEEATAAEAGAGTAAAAALCGQRQCIVLDSLSRLVDVFGAPDTARALRALQRAPATSCLLGSLHGDLHAAHEAAALTSLAACVATLTPSPDDGPADASSGGKRAHGRATTRGRTRAGRLRTETRAYEVLGWADVATWAPAVAAAKPAAPDAAAAGKPAAPEAAGAGAAAALAPRLAGGMRLELSAEEERARAAVALPYEHQGQEARYQVDDFRQYLPPQAGGTACGAPAPGAGGGGGLGRIHYVRDSESEPDSDEDPDDDLDI